MWVQAGGKGGMNDRRQQQSCAHNYSSKCHHDAPRTLGSGPPCCVLPTGEQWACVVYPSCSAGS